MNKNKNVGLVSSEALTYLQHNGLNTMTNRRVESEDVMDVKKCNVTDMKSSTTSGVLVSPVTVF